MSRLSDILGVKEGQEFRFDNDGTIYQVTGNVLYYYRATDDIWSDCYGFAVYDMIAHPELISIIPEKITLTERQITAIKGRIAEGTPWIAHDEANSIYLYNEKPKLSKDKKYFWGDDSVASYSPLYDFVTFENSPIYLPDLIGSENDEKN